MGKIRKSVMVKPLNEDNDVQCFAILHKADDDPLKIHKTICDGLYLYN